MARLYNYIVETETGKTDYTKLPSASRPHKFLLERVRLRGFVKTLVYDYPR